jgi:hypothetical protein
LRNQESSVHQYDPDEIVRWPGLGYMSLKTAVRRVMELSLDDRMHVALFRDAGKEPSAIGIIAIQEIAKLPAFSLHNRWSDEKSRKA